MLDFNSLKAKFAHLTPIDRGGQKEVFGAIHPTYGDVVLKLFFKMDARSQREIDISTNSGFDCVPVIFETGLVDYGGADTLYVIEQRVEGEELSKRIERGDYFTLKEAVEFLEQGLSFVKQLESKSIVHRDIKPGNIIISNSGKVFFIDFGIARVLGLPSLTMTGVMGPHTPGYAAPEQFNNLKSDIDSRADLFSIGVVTYECLTGKNPFREGAGSHMEILIRTETITPVSYEISGDTQQQFMGLLSSLMGKLPSRRPSDATQALNWLNGAKTTLQI